MAFAFAFEKWKDHFSRKSRFFHFSKAKVKVNKVKKSLFKSDSESEKSEKITFPEKVLKWKKWKAKVIIFPVPMYGYS